MASAPSTNSNEGAFQDDMLSQILQQSSAEYSVRSNDHDSQLGLTAVGTVTIPTGSGHSQTITGSAMSVEQACQSAGDDNTFTVIHKGRMYTDVKQKDLDQGRISAKVNRLVPENQYELFRQQQRKNDEATKRTLGRLAGHKQWSDFRQRCQALDMDVNRNERLPTDLRALAKEEIRTGLINGAVETAVGIILGSDAEAEERKWYLHAVLEGLGHKGSENREKFLRSLFNAALMAALCGWPIRGVAYKLSHHQAAILQDLGKVDVKNSPSFEVDETKAEETT